MTGNEPETTVEVDLTAGETLDGVECPLCGRPYDRTEWEIGHGCGRCGFGFDHCPTDDCDGSVYKYF